MFLDKNTYWDKVMGCWMGKNIGGTLGAPFEAERTVQDVEFYTTDLKAGALPNDDLDLQLSWLNAAERYGCRVDAKVLAEYWVSTIMPNWAEYGVGKSNLRIGLEPPVSGAHHNAFKDSNGAWIRSELWACLMPGHPELAVKYAYEDASVDHADEGVYAEVFTCALENAAFVVSDPEELINIGLSYLPENSEVAHAIRVVQECYAAKMDWKQARHELLMTIPDSFGRQRHDKPNVENFPEGTWGFDAPANIGIVVLGWLYGQGDFGRSICIAAGCGEDGDCTTATLGAILGILMGRKAIPQEWVAPVGDEIKTITLNTKCSLLRIPKTVTELTERTARLMPAFMIGFFDMYRSGAEIEMNDPDNMRDRPTCVWMEKPVYFAERYPKCHATFTAENAIMRIAASVPEGLDVACGDTREICIHAENISGFVGSQLWLELRLILPEGWTCEDGTSACLFLNQYHCGTGNACCTFRLNVAQPQTPIATVVVEVTAHDRPGRLYLPVEFTYGTRSRDDAT